MADTHDCDMDFRRGRNFVRVATVFLPFDVKTNDIFVICFRLYVLITQNRLILATNDVTTTTAHDNRD